MFQSGLFYARAFRRFGRFQIHLVRARCREKSERQNLPVPEEETDDLLLSLASEIEPDGGMWGKNIEERVLSSVVALLCFLEKGHTPKAGTFRAHVERLISFLESELVRSLSSEQQMSVDKIIKLARSGRVLPGDWCELASKPPTGSSTEPKPEAHMGDVVISVRLTHALTVVRRATEEFVREEYFKEVS